MIRDAQAGTAYEAERGWWSVIAADGVPVGFVLPVVFTGCARDGLDEGAIYHIGVVPEHRGRGLGRLLLGRATDTLLAHGVWQISTDTAAENNAMVRVFTAAGYIRREPVFVPA
jgi:GNAT superfamily N-acetyltransferase